MLEYIQPKRCNKRDILEDPGACVSVGAGKHGLETAEATQKVSRTG